MFFVLFFFNDTATTEIYTRSLHDALPISQHPGLGSEASLDHVFAVLVAVAARKDDDAEAERHRSSALGGVLRCGLMLKLDAIVFDHGVGEELLAHAAELAFGGVAVLVRQLEFEIFSLADILDTAKTKAGKGVAYGFALGVEDAIFKSDVDAGLHGCEVPLLHDRRALEVARACLGQDTQPAGNFLIGLGDVPQVAAEAVLVQLFGCRAVPEAAGIGADFIAE